MFDPKLIDLELAVAEALQIAWDQAGYDGVHHKEYVIDQMVRALLGSQYDEWVRRYEGDDYTWPTGIAT